nr:hypothetical protein [Tanacetum cinerariifolium]
MMVDLFPLEMVKVEYLEKMQVKFQIMMGRMIKSHEVSLKGYFNKKGRLNTLTVLIVFVSLPVNTTGPSFVNAALPLPINAAGTPASTNAFKEHPYE